MGGGGVAGSMARVRRSRRQAYSPVPPHEMLPARTVIVPGRGEFFLRDSGETDPARPTVMLLHGWMVTADLNWHGAYDALVGRRLPGAGGRPSRPRPRACAPSPGSGWRTAPPTPPRSCASSELAPAVVVGYSMGGVIAQLMARDHPDVMSGLVLSGTCQHFQDPETRRMWKWMGVVGVLPGPRPAPVLPGGVSQRQDPPQRAHRLVAV